MQEPACQNRGAKIREIPCVVVGQYGIGSLEGNRCAGMQRFIEQVRSTYFCSSLADMVVGGKKLIKLATP